MSLHEVEEDEGTATYTRRVFIPLGMTLDWTRIRYWIYTLLECVPDYILQEYDSKRNFVLLNMFVV